MTTNQDGFVIGDSRSWDIDECCYCFKKCGYNIVSGRCLWREWKNLIKHTSLPLFKPLLKAKCRCQMMIKYSIKQSSVTASWQDGNLCKIDPLSCRQWISLSLSIQFQGIARRLMPRPHARRSFERKTGHFSLNCYQHGSADH